MYFDHNEDNKTMLSNKFLFGEVLCALKSRNASKKLDVFNLTTSYGSIGTYDGACLVRLANLRIQAIELYEWDWDRAAHDLD